MVFNRKAEEIRALTAANEFLQTQRDQLGPYDEVAKDLYDTVQQELATTEDPDAAYDAAYASVREGLVTAGRERQRQQIIAANQPRWESEIDEQIMADEGEAIAAEARRDFFENKAAPYRAAAEPRIAAKIAQMTHDGLIAELDEETRDRLLEQAVEQALREEQYKQRLERIQDISQRHAQLDLGDLEDDEVIIVDFCARGEAADEMPDKRADNRYNGNVPIVRTLKLSIVSARAGLVLVLDDSWQKDADDLRAQEAIEDNTYLVIGTIHPGTAEVEASIHRGGLLYTMQGDKELQNPFEVSHVWLRDDCIL